MNKTAPPMGRTNRANKLFVEKPEVFEELVDSLGSIVKPKLGFHDDSSFMSKEAAKSAEERRKERYRLENMQTEALWKKNLSKRMEVAKDKKEKRFPVLLTNVNKALSFLDEIDKEINVHDETQKNKVRRQYEDWNTNVHGAIQKRISNTIGKMESKQLNKKKNEDYAKFLNVTNKKPAIFRDIIIESEYDPLEPNRHCIKAKTGKLKDPVKIDAQKAEAEAAMLDASAVVKVKLGKETLPVELWAAGKIEATPHGTFARMMKSDPEGGSKQKSSATHKSSIAFDDFQFPRGRKAIDAEMPKGKRIYPATVYANPDRIFNTLPAHVEQEIAQIKPPENSSWINTYRDIQSGREAQASSKRSP